MTNLNKTDLLSLEEYSANREDLRAEVLKIKKDRLIQIGENICLLFEVCRIPQTFGSSKGLKLKKIVALTFKELHIFL